MLYSIRHKALLGFVCILAVVAGFSYWAMQQFYGSRELNREKLIHIQTTQSETATIMSEQFQLVRIVADLQPIAWHIQHEMLLYLMGESEDIKPLSVVVETLKKQGQLLVKAWPDALPKLALGELQASIQIVDDIHLEMAQTSAAVQLEEMLGDAHTETQALIVSGQKVFTLIYHLTETSSAEASRRIQSDSQVISGTLESMENNFISFAAAVVVTFLLTFLMFFFSGSWLLRRLDRAVSVVDRMAGGNLSVTINVRRRDEVGLLLAAIARMGVRLRDMVGSVADTTHKLERAAVDISASIQEEVAIATEQSASVSEISSAMEELSATSSQIAENAQSVLEIATLTQEESEQGQQAVETVLEQLEEIIRDNQQSTREILELGEKSREVSKIMDMINAIADQTKLIAFNAAIEASSAGEAGKRFGVVAVEIRRLAGSVMESTEEIMGTVKRMQQSVHQLVVSSEKGAQGIQEGKELTLTTTEMLQSTVERARATTEAVTQISLSTQQQKTASDQVVLSLREIEEGSRHIMESINGTNQTCQELADQAKILTGQVSHFKLKEDQPED